MERTIEQRLSALYKLQNLDSKLDDIKRMRGDLPDEVRDLEDDIAQLETRISKFQAEIKEFEQEAESRKQRKKEAEKLILKYKDQQNNVRNNREYEALTKEIESEELEIQLCDKRVREANEKISRKNEEITDTELGLSKQRKELDVKKIELNTLLEESEAEETKILKEREKHIKNIEDRLYRSYTKIRDNAINGLAVVMVRRDACGGCFNVVPLQRQADIREKKKLIVCEHCGRVFAGVEDAPVIEDKTPKAKTTRKVGVKVKAEGDVEEEELI
jgi:hypothetical protein